MSIIRKFNRARARDTRRREASRRRRLALPEPAAERAGADAEPRDVAFATVTGPFGVLREFLGLGECACPVCEYLAERDIPSETLEDGTLVHQLTAQEHEEIIVLMKSLNPFVALGDSKGPSDPITH